MMGMAPAWDLLQKTKSGVIRVETGRTVSSSCGRYHLMGRNGGAALYYLTTHWEPLYREIGAGVRRVTGAVPFIWWQH